MTDLAQNGHVLAFTPEQGSEGAAATSPLSALEALPLLAGVRDEGGGGTLRNQVEHWAGNAPPSMARL